MAKISKMIIFFIFLWVLNLCWGSEKSRQGSSNFNLTSVQIIRKYGYPAETHEVETEDGYILELHRIPHGKTSTSTRGLPLLVTHGLIGASSQYLLLKSESFAFVLADAGYDVWLINFRGCKYSKKHRVLSPDYMKFWDFSWHEHGVYDIPASIDYILRVTQRQQLLYIGYSMGTTSFFVMSSERPEYQEKIRGAILMGPTAYIGQASSPLRHYAGFANGLKGGLEFIEHEEIFEHGTEPRYSGKTCEEQILCRTAVYFLCGSDSVDFQSVRSLIQILVAMKILKIISTHMPASTSLKSIAHFGQLLESGKFQNYDYGVAKNLIKYHQTKPPEYNLQATIAPLSLFISPKDYFNNKDDQERTLRLLPNIKSMYIVPEHNFTHLDFIISQDAKELVYDKVVEQVQHLINHGHE